MAYSFTRLGHQAANQWETWNISSLTGEVFSSAIVVGRTSSATAIMIDFGIDFSYNISSIIIVRYNGTAFTAGETCDVYTVNGGSSVGTFVIAAGGATSTNISDIVVVTGTDTANLFSAVWTQSNSAGWGYESTTNSEAVLDCSIMCGNPFQAAVFSGISKNESVELNGSLFVMGNSTYASQFDLGEGTYGDVGTTRNGCTINNDTSVAPIGYFGACRYGKFNAYGSYIATVRSGWEADFTNVTTFNVTNLGSMEFFTFPITGVGRESTDITRLYNCTAGGGIVVSHGDLVFNDVYIGENGTYGLIFFGPGDLTAQNLTVLDSSAVSDAFGFIAAGTKTFLNCTLDEQDVSGFWSNYTSVHQYSLDITSQTPSGSDVEDVRVRAWDSSQDILSDTPKFNVLSDANGEFAQQVVTYATAGSPATYESFQPFTFFVNKAGFEEDLFNFTFTEEATFSLSMENVEKDYS